MFVKTIRVLYVLITILFIYFKTKTNGFEMTNIVYQYLKLIESDYFGLEYIDSKGKKVSYFLVNMLFLIYRVEKVSQFSFYIKTKLLQLF